MSNTLELYSIDKLCLLTIDGLLFTKNYSMALREAKKLAEEKKRERLEEKRARYVVTQYIVIIFALPVTYHQRKSQATNS